MVERRCRKEYPKSNLFAPPKTSKHVCKQLRDADLIRKSRIHPIAILLAADTYGAGHGLKGKGEWTPVPQVIDALDDTFYMAFENATSTGKRFYLGLDISVSMLTRMMLA